MHDPENVAGIEVPGLVSVTIPSFNRGYIVGKAIESVLAQTYKQLEIIVVDDGSSDNTADVVKAFGQAVRYVYQPNGGLSSARNTGLRHARGEFVALFDSDDEWFPWKLEAQVAIMRARPDVGMVWSDMTALDEHHRVGEARHLRTCYSGYRAASIEKVCTRLGHLADMAGSVPAEYRNDPVYVGRIYSQMILGNLVHPPTVLLRRSWLKGLEHFDTTLRWGGDGEFLTRVCALGPVALLDAPTMYYRIEAADQMTRPDKELVAAEENLACLQRFLSSDLVIELPKRVLRRRLAESYGWLGRAELKIGSRQRAASALWRSLLQYPTISTATQLGLCLAPPAVYQGMRRIRQLGVSGALKHVRVSS